MPTILITGASGGLGLEFAKQYARDGWKVIATCRNPDRAAELRAIEGDIQVHALDVTDRGRIQVLSKALRRIPIDLLLNNAGIYGPRPVSHSGIDYDAWEEVMRTNTMGTMSVTTAFLEQVAASDRKTIVAITSKMGSITENTSGGAYIYRSSKAALNAVMKGLSIDLQPRGITVAVIHPGWVKTAMGGASAMSGVEESVTSMRRVIDNLTYDQNGMFFDFDGSEIPW